MTIRAALAVFPALLSGWLALLVAVTLYSDDAPGVLVLFPGDAFSENLPGDVAITGASAFSVTLASDRPNFAASLYAIGARIVLPAGLLGCGR